MYKGLMQNFLKIMENLTAEVASAESGTEKGI